MRKIYIPSTKPEDWQSLLADPEKHWRRGYSARALACCWQEAECILNLKVTSNGCEIVFCGQIHLKRKWKMNRWLRTLITFIRAQFLKDINPDEETSLNFRVWITDVDLSIMNNAAMLSITEMGRIDLMIRTGFLKHAWRNKLYVPLASISAQFRRPLKRFQKFQLKTQLIYWDEKWIYISHRIECEEKIIAVALAKCTVKKGTEVIPFESIIHKLNWEMKPKNQPEMIDRFERGETLFLKTVKHE